MRDSAIACCMLQLPLLGRAALQDSDSKDKKPEKKARTKITPLELVAYCGLYCGSCDIYQERIGNSGRELKKVLDALEFDQISKQVPGLEDYDKFYKVLNNIIMFFGQCQGCQKGGGNPSCEIRNCCRQKGYDTCAECESFPCEKIQPMLDSYPPMKDDIKDIQKMGMEKWSQKQQKKVDEGYRYSDYSIKKEK